MPVWFYFRFLARETVQELPWVDVSWFISLDLHGVVSGYAWRRVLCWDEDGCSAEVTCLAGQPSYLNCCFSQLSFREWLLLELEVCP